MNASRSYFPAMGAVLAIVFLTLVAIMPTKPPTFVIVLVAALGIVFALWHYWGADPVDFLQVEEDEEVLTGVDVWAYQRALMLASGQRMPVLPRFHNGVVLYGALIMEESGETYAGLGKAMDSWVASNPSPLAREIAARFHDMANSCAFFAGEIRQSLGKLEIDEVMPPSVAIELFDGTTDLAVVNAGFALSCGFPGDAGYLEVGKSNLSKRNPDTLVIDKTTDGKWIKGKGYKGPDLAMVLAKQWRDVQAQHRAASL